ncbi:MAG: acyl-CoA dehydratase activase-related protein [Desulfotomaculales bacterium]
MSFRVGIPSTLLYYLYFPEWEAFFQYIGTEVVTSGRTNKKALDYGVREALADACVPIKLYFGHVLSLLEKGIDYLFVPRVVCLNRENTYCPKFLGLPDMIKSVLYKLPPLIDTRVDIREGYTALFRFYEKIGEIFGASRLSIARAFFQARRVQKRYLSILRTGLTPLEAMEILKGKGPPPSPGKYEINLAVLGYPYLVYDQFVSVGLLNKLKKMGIGVVTLENFPARLLAGQKNLLDKRLFWTFSDAVYKATQVILRDRKVDGIIHLTAFGCGPDAMLDKFMEMLVREHSEMPFMTLTVDEHSGEAGITTRLEAFADMVRRKKGARSCA